MEKGQNLTVAERIRHQFEGLTRAERQLANAMLENYPVSALGSITAVAEASDVSTPTVARMARKLGVTQAWLKGEAESGRVPCLRAGSRFLFSPDAVR